MRNIYVGPSVHQIHNCIMNLSDAVALAQAVCNSGLSTLPTNIVSQLTGAARYVTDWDHVVPRCLRLDLDTVDAGWRAVPGRTGGLPADMLKIRDLHASVTGTRELAAAVSSGLCRLDLSTYLDIGLFQTCVFHGELTSRDVMVADENPNEPVRMRKTLDCMTIASRLMRNETASVHRRIVELDSVADKYKAMAADPPEHGMELWHTSAQMIGIYRMEPFEQGMRPYIYWSDDTHSWSNNTDIMRKRKAYTLHRSTHLSHGKGMVSFPAASPKRVALVEWQRRRASAASGV